MGKSSGVAPVVSNMYYIRLFLYEFVSVTLRSVLVTVRTVFEPLQSQFRWAPLQFVL